MAKFLQEKKEIKKILIFLLSALLAAGLPFMDREFYPATGGIGVSAYILAYIILVLAPLIAVAVPLFFVDTQLLMEKTKWPIIFFPILWILFWHVSFGEGQGVVKDYLLQPLDILFFSLPFRVAHLPGELFFGFCVAVACLLPILYLKLKQVEFKSKFQYYLCLISYLYLNITFIAFGGITMFFE